MENKIIKYFTIAAIVAVICVATVVNFITAEKKPESANAVFVSTVLY